MTDSLRVGFFTHSPTEIAFSFYRTSMEGSGYINFISKIDDGRNFDVLLVMQHADDLRSLAQFRQNYPDVLTGVVDPRGRHVLHSLLDTDFFVVDSLEKRDYFLGYGRPVFLYHDVLHLPHQEKQHQNSGKIVIGYHGNRVHLEAMFPVVTAALEKLGEEMPIEIWAIYNREHLGPWSWVPKNVEVRHLQWDESRLPEYLSRIDVGISPNAMPVANAVRARRRMSIFSKYFHEKDEDYLIRFKVPTNPGRIYVFANASIPVVSDLTLSSLRWIEPGVSGEIAHHTGAWYHALKGLALNSEIRNAYAARLWEKMERDFSPKYQNEKFRIFLVGLLAGVDRTKAPSVIAHAELDFATTLGMRFKFFKNHMRMKIYNFVRRIKRKILSS